MGNVVLCDPVVIQERDPLAGMEIESCNISSETVRVGEQVVVSVEVRNTNDFPVRFTYRIFFDDDFRFRRGAPLAPGESEFREWDITVQPEDQPSVDVEIRLEAELN